MYKYILTVLLGTYSLLGFPQSIVAVKPPIPLTPTEHIEKIFGDKAQIMKAIFMAESHLNVRSVGYNCHYYTKDGKRYSDSCKKEDRPKAWSVDCGIAQINTKGQVCPEHLFVIENNLAIAKQKLDTQGLKAWNVYTSGKYKKYML